MVKTGLGRESMLSSHKEVILFSVQAYKQLDRLKMRFCGHAQHSASNSESERLSRISSMEISLRKVWCKCLCASNVSYNLGATLKGRSSLASEEPTNLGMHINHLKDLVSTSFLPSKQVHTCIPRIWQAGAGVSRMQGQLQPGIQLSYIPTLATQ